MIKRFQELDKERQDAAVLYFKNHFANMIAFGDFPFSNDNTIVANEVAKVIHRNESTPWFIIEALIYNNITHTFIASMAMDMAKETIYTDEVTVALSTLDKIHSLSNNKIN